MKPPSTRSTLFKKRLRGFTRALDGVEKGADEKALHRTRVASRRLRELLPVLGLEPDVTRKLTRKLRKITERLGRVRERDVLLLLIDDLHVSRPVHREALRRVGHLVGRARDEARRELGNRLPASEMWKLARRLERVVERIEAAETGRDGRGARGRARSTKWAIDARIARRSERLVRAIEAAGAVYLPERLHRVRIAVKKLRYALELDTSGSADRADALDTLKRVQALLGRMHDLQVLIDWVRAAQARLVPPNLVAWREMDALVVALDEACRRLHARYVHERDALRAIGGGKPRMSAAAGRHPERQAG